MKPAKPVTKEEKDRKLNRFLFWFPIIFIFAIGFLHFNFSFERLDSVFVDGLFRMRGMERGDPRIVIVTIDDASIKKVGQYPWPRRVYKKLLDRLLNDFGAKTVALDIIFPDPSRPDDDSALIGAVKRAGGRVVLGVSTDPTVVNQHVFVYPFEALKKVSKAMGAVVQPFISGDGSVRETALLVGEKPRTEYFNWPEDPKSIPSLGIASLAQFEGKDWRSYIEKFGPRIRLNWRGEVERRVGTQMVDGQLQEVYSSDYGFRRISAWTILTKELMDEDRESLKGAIVLVGSTAVGAFDHYPSPFTELMPGVEVHANLIDNVMHGRTLGDPSMLLTFLLIIAMTFIAKRLVTIPPIWAGLVFLVLFASWAGVNYFAFLNLHLFDFTAPALALLGTFGALMVHKTMVEAKQKSQVRAMFGQYVAPEVVSILVQDPDKLKLGGEKRDMTMFFLDIAHFTTISEKMKPEALIQFLNTYLTSLTDDILNNNGVVDKYIGDCIMAFWNAPLDEPAHRRKACLAAVDCLKTMERLNREYVDPTIPERPAVRIGLNSGEVVVGNTGSARKLAYTVLGDEVNLASRLEGANKFFGSTVMASEDTFKGTEDAVEGRFLGKVRVVGKEIPIGVYELLGRKGELTKQWQEALARYQEALEIYHKRDFEKAKAAFEKVQEIIPEDKPSKLYLNVCGDYMTIAPPEREDWAVFNLTSK